MKFRYIKIPTRDPRRKWISRPIIPVILSAQKGVVARSVNVDALLDSGADKCLFNAEIGEALGLELEKGERETFSGIEGGRLFVFIHEVYIQVAGIDRTTKVEAGFVRGLNISAIVGQDGFFDSFRVSFEKDRNIIEIKCVS